MSGGTASRKFPKGVSEKLKNYVYRLIDPRDGTTFYVGRGKGDRVFAHARDELKGDTENEKLQRIRMIRSAGFDVIHVIHRHGMDLKMAVEVEAALIEAYPGLTNIQGGAGQDFGVAHADEIIRRYQAREAAINHKCLLININRSAADASTYDAVRYSWRISKARAERAEYVLATFQGLIVGAFVAEQWLKATEKNFPGLSPNPKRYGFYGHEAEESVKRRYVGKRMPEVYQQRGAANPVKYTYE